MRKHYFLILSVLFFLAPYRLWAQENITGKVISDTGEPLPGITVSLIGTRIGTITDASGNFNITIPAFGAQLRFSSLGMVTQTLSVTDNKLLQITLASDAGNLDEVVVVGYGTQKRATVTGAISSVKASDLETMPVNRVEQSLQGRTSGVTVAANSGQPGSAATVRIRGITTLNNNDPLWVVDGVVVDNGGIGYLNQSDIASIEVLKDASAQAIYGARAASGVILVTTKKGGSDGLRINYNGYYGLSAPAKKLNLLNATEYATLRNEAAINAGNAAPFQDPSSLGVGTDWQEAIFNNSASRQNHELSISGGSDKSSIYTSFGYLEQDGIVATEISKYKRINFRINSTYKPASWITFGENVGYSREKSTGLGNTNSEFGGPLSSAINLDPITPLIVTDPNLLNTAPYNRSDIVRDRFGNPYGISSQLAQEITNPLAYIQTRLGNYGWSDNIVGNAYVEVEPITGLKVRSSLGAKISFWGAETFTPIFYLNTSTSNTQTSFRREQNRSVAWNVENTASYTKQLNDHRITLLAGQGAYMDNNNFGGNGVLFGIPSSNFDDASQNYIVPRTDRDYSGSEGVIHHVASLFARINYNYKEKYLLEALVRRDGSTRFGPNNKYGTFPSFSAGWVASEEEFLKQNNVLNFLKFRGGYGVVGNDNIGDFGYVATIGSGRNYPFGLEGNYLVGYSPNSVANPNLRWEETASTSIGFDAVIFNDFNLTFDWFHKETKDILQNLRIPSYVGVVNNPPSNVASMVNKGIEIELGYSKKFGELNFRANGNISYIKNEVSYLGEGRAYIEGGQSFQSSSYPITRTAVGQPINSFFGFRPLGIFQTQEEIDGYVGADGSRIQPNARPGDFKWADLNGDGTISENDRDFIGNPNPKLTYGLTVNLAYKGFDLMLFGQGAGGYDIFQGLRRLDITNANWQTNALDRWTGPGTSNDYPRLTENDDNRNFTNPSTFYLESGSYFRLKVAQLGYNFSGNWMRKVGARNLRVYLMSENLFTITGYSGYDPEIGGGNGSSIDRGIYPQARSFMVGVNVGF